MELNVSHSNIKDLKADKVVFKQLKQLSRKTTGEQFKTFDDDIIILCKSNNKTIGMCNIAMKSPESHFENEQESEVAYLYNYCCDLTHKKKKPSVAIMTYIKEYILNSNIEKKEINLDVLVGNKHAMQFFEKNNFVIVGDYSNNAILKDYKSYTCTL